MVACLSCGGGAEVLVGFLDVRIDRTSVRGNVFVGASAKLSAAERSAVCCAYAEALDDPPRADLHAIAMRHGVQVSRRRSRGRAFRGASCPRERRAARSLLPLADGRGHRRGGSARSH